MSEHEQAQPHPDPAPEPGPGPAIDPARGPGLDPGQRAVVDAAGRESLAVIGAPGSGRTTALVELVAARVEAGTPPERILAVAANRRLAAALRDRLHRRIRLAARGATLGRTMPSVAMEIIAGHRARTGEAPPKLLTGSQQDAILADLLAGELDETGTVARRRGAAGWPEWLSPETLALRGFRDELRALLAAMAEHGVGPERLAALAADPAAEPPAGERHRALWAGAAVLARDYDDVLGRAYESAYDTPTSLAEAARLLGERDGAGRPALGDLELVVVDDAQELTEPARRLLAALERAGASIVTFGDPDLATGAFHGGRAEFATNWRDTGDAAPPRLLLPLVHRHGPELRALVAETSQRAGARGEGAHRKAPSALPPIAGADPDAIPVAAHRACASESEEADLAAGWLRRLHLTEGVPWREMAVITRTGARLPQLARAFDRAGIPTVSSTPVAAADDATVRAILDLAGLAVHGEPEAMRSGALQRILASPLHGVDPLEFRRVRRAAYLAEAAAHAEAAGDGAAGDGAAAGDAEPRVERSGLNVLVDTVEAEAAGGRDAVGSDVLDALAGSARPHAANAVRALVDVLRRMRARLGEAEPIDTVLYEAWRDPRRADEWQRLALAGGAGSAELHRRLDALVVLFDRAKRFVEREPGASLASFLAEWQRDSVVDDSLGGRVVSDAVTLTTPAGAVGLEWRAVVAIGMNEGVWPNLRVRDTLLGAGRLEEALSDERPAPIVDRRRAVLDDETRMLVAALSRSREHLLITSVADEERQPSPFLRWLGLPELPDRFAIGDASGLGYGQVTLSGLAARLRHELADVADDETGDHVDAERALARLAAEGVAGAHPREWWGIRGRSTLAPLRRPDDDGVLRLSVSPSAIDRFRECGVDWFIGEQAREPSTSAQTMGKLFHLIAERHSEFDDEEALREFARGEFAQIEHEAEWLGEAQWRRIEIAIESLWKFLRKRESVVEVATEARIETLIETSVPTSEGGEAEIDVELRGRIDRVERTGTGIRIIDFKSGRSAPSEAKTLVNGQLRAYQLAFHGGALAEHGAAPEHGALAAAALVYPELPLTDRLPTERAQPALPLEQLDDLRDELVVIAVQQAGIPVAGDTIELEAAPVFIARPVAHCGTSRYHRCALQMIPEVTE